jgi:hypothetical protein
MRRFIVFSVIAVLSSASALSAQSLPGDKGGFTLSPARTSTMKSTTFLYVSMETTNADLGSVVTALMMQFDDSMKSGLFLPTGGPVFEYHQSMGDQNKPFTLRVGYPVADGTKAFGGFQVGKLTPKKAATAIFVGRASSLGQAYQKLYTEIAVAGLTPGDVRRERFLFYEDQQSANNIMQIEIELKD